MAKRKRTVTRSHTGQSTSYRPGFSRGTAGPGGRSQMKPPSERRNNTLWWIGGAAVVALVLAVLVYIYAFAGGSGSGASPSPSELAHPFRSPGPTVNVAMVHPPSATPMASPLADVAGDGTTATLHTDLGDITFEVYNQSAPVASENFINLANAGFYNNLTFHRIVPDFVIQGGDPNGDGTGGPGYEIPDETVVGQYGRGIVAMARTSQPNSAGSQFFIVLSDDAEQALAQYNTYVIFGKVTAGMDVADQIALTPNSGSASGNQALDPTYINTVTIQPGTGATPAATSSAAAASPSLPAASPSTAASPSPS